MRNYVILHLTQSGHWSPQTSDSFGDVHHTLCLEPLQQDADSNERPSSPAATTVNSMKGITYVAGLLLCIHACIQHFIVSYLLQLLVTDDVCQV